MSVRFISRATLPFLVVVVVVGLNLRPFLTAVGPLAAGIRAEIGLSYQDLAILTLVPMLLMGALAFVGPALQGVLGARRAMVAALAVLCLGSLLRFFAVNGVVMIATAVLCGLGVAVIQAILPGIIKARFAERAAVVTGLYSAMLMGGGAFGAQLAPLIAKGTGSWRLGLAWLAVPAALALVMVLCCLPRGEGQQASLPGITFLKRPRTWLLMVCFGLVNGGYSTVVAWLASFYQGQGWPPAASGNLLALMALGQAAAALLLPILAGWGRDRRPWLWLTLAMQFSGFAGLAFWSDLVPYGWALLVGAGLGGCFALCLVVALDHLPDPAQAGALSALMQGGGFLLAALPPWIVALLHESSGNLAPGWVFHLGCVSLVTLLVCRFRPEGYAGAMAAEEAKGLAGSR